MTETVAPLTERHIRISNSSMAQYELERMTGRCSVSGREFEEGEEFFTVIFEQEEGFVRRDFALDAWSEPPEGAFCFFKTKVPVKEKRKKLLVDDELLINFFQRLANESEPVRVQFRFVLALILMRKRLLAYEGSEKTDGEDRWRMKLVRDGSSHLVVDPKLTDDQIAGVSEQVTAILHGDMGHWADEASEVAESGTGDGDEEGEADDD